MDCEPMFWCWGILNKAVFVVGPFTIGSNVVLPVDAIMKQLPILCSFNLVFEILITKFLSIGTVG